MSHQPIEQSALYLEAKRAATQVWFLVKDWENFAKWTVGRQLVTCLDSIASNLAEGDGRYSDRDALHFFTIARGSLRESGYWIEVARERGLIDIETAENLRSSTKSIGKQLNGLISYRRLTNNKNLVKEANGKYDMELGEGDDALRLTLDAPFTEELQFNEG